MFAGARPRPKSKVKPGHLAEATSSGSVLRKKTVIKGSLRESILGQGGKRAASALDYQHIPSRIHFPRSALKPLPKDDPADDQNVSSTAAEASVSAASSTSGGPPLTVDSGCGTATTPMDAVHPRPSADGDSTQEDRS